MSGRAHHPAAEAAQPGAVPDALLLITPECAHCSAVLEALSGLVKLGGIGRLEVINIQARPQTADQLGVRSVPWIRIGDIELSGAHTAAELAVWAGRAGSPSGYGLYLADLLEQGRLDRVTALIRAQPPRVRALVGLLGSLETPMAARIGAGAVLEDLAGSDALEAAAGALLELLKSAQPQIRADACHYLGLTEDPRARQAVQPLLHDSDAEVREIARETLDSLPAAIPPESR